jgi:hypothetical protein
MASLATKAAKRVVEQHAKQFEPEDPYYETWVDSKGKQKRRKVSECTRMNGSACIGKDKD